MSGRRPILGVDIDNVLALSDACLRAMIRKHFRITIRGEDITQYDYTGYGVTEEQLGEVFQLFNTATCRTLKVVAGAQVAMRQLAKRYEIALVTARNPESQAGTEYWLKAKGIPYDQLHFNEEKHALGIPYHAFIEDRHEHAHRIAETCSSVYLLSRPWNMTCPTHPNVRRVETWAEILKYLL